MDMTETKVIEESAARNSQPTMGQPRVYELDWEYQARQSRRERSKHLAASFRALSRRVRNTFAKMRGQSVVAQTVLQP